MSLQEIPAYARLPLDVAGAEGRWLFLRDGRRVLDLYGGHCVLSLGAGDRELGAALAAQWQRCSFVTNLIELEQRHEFLEAFGANLPPGDWRVFLSNSGAEANENALKAALAATGREAVVVFEGAFHGRTAAATWASDARARGFPRAPFEPRRVPWGDLEAARRAASGAAALLLEPIQSLAGVVDPPPGFLAGLRAIADETGAALVFDEVQTGSGRLGSPWASTHFGVVPDLFTTAKGAGGGFPIGITVVAESWSGRFDAGLCGSTFGGSPLALCAATVVAHRVAQPQFLAGVRAAAQVFARLAEHPLVARVRGTGLLLGLELVPGLAARELRDALLDEGVLVGLSQDPRVLRLSPALTITPAEASGLVAALARIDLTART